jgi:hypothetical protein
LGQSVHSMAPYVYLFSATRRMSSAVWEKREWLARSLKCRSVYMLPLLCSRTRPFCHL